MAILRPLYRGFHFFSRPAADYPIPRQTFKPKTPLERRVVCPEGSCSTPENLLTIPKPPSTTTAHHWRRPRRCLLRIHHVTRSYLSPTPSIRRPPSCAQVWRRVLTRSKSTRCAKSSFRLSMATPKCALCFLSFTVWNADRAISRH